jgi:long-chain acyl-CoA synthetase
MRGSRLLGKSPSLRPSMPVMTPNDVGGGQDIIACTDAGTLWGLFCARARRTPDSVAYRDYNPAADAWRDHTWRAIAARVDRFRAALAAEPEVRAQDRVAVLAPNGIDWVCFDIAAHALGLVVVALYPHDSPANNAYILGHSDARLLFIDTQARWQSLVAFRAEYPGLACVWLGDAVLESAPAKPGFNLRRLPDLLVRDAPPPPAAPVAPTALATLIYTSGTTGRPKGVMLSHYALLWNAEASSEIIPPRPDDMFLSILPLAHAFERTVGYYLPMMGGSAVTYARSARDLAADLVAVKPTVLIGVPRLFERMCATIQERVEGNVVKQVLLRLTASMGWQRRHGRFAVGELVWPLIRCFVALPVMAAFGGRLRVAVSGGAPLSAGVARFLMGLGLPLVEGYGLTEAAPVVAAAAIGDSMPGSAGRVLPGVDVMVSERGKLLVRSPSVMMGYWKDQAATARALDTAGWLSTGDLAEIREGRVFVTGRVNEMLVLSIGEKVNPNFVEAEIMRDPLFEQVVVVGNGRPCLVALIVLRHAAWQQFAAQHNENPNDPDTSSVKIKTLARVEQLLAGFPRYAQVRAVHLTARPWTVETGLLTPTLKIKRDVVQRVFTEQIEQLYAELRGAPIMANQSRS